MTASVRLAWIYIAVVVGGIAVVVGGIVVEAGPSDGYSRVLCFFLRSCENLLAV